MKVKYAYKRLELLPENKEEEAFCLSLHRTFINAQKVIAWYGDVNFDGKETSGYVFTSREEKLKSIDKKAGKE